ncbi:hypothetical protein, partial [Flavobacterium sp.]|uniref:hypothetical protein n=1 Tax=Flavobacterium sp. TaxID=239 RepID=UPI0025C4E2CA
GRQNRSCREPFCYFCGEAKVSPAGRRRIKIKACGSAAAERSKKAQLFYLRFESGQDFRPHRKFIKEKISDKQSYRTKKNASQKKPTRTSI